MAAPAECFNTPIIRTKLSAPQLHAGLVARPLLLDQLKESFFSAFTLVCAPAGYGKTTLLANWIAGLKKTGPPDPPAVCWLSLDAGDNEPIHFLRCLAAAFETANIEVSAEACAMLQATPPLPPQSILAVLINDLEKLTISIYLVLDDYQFISAPAVHEVVRFMLEHPLPNFHLVMATRSDPPFPLARLRARRQLTEIRASDLRFSLAEADYLFNQVMSLGLTPTDMTVLEERTEGWIAGLQMAALALQGISQTRKSDISSFIHNFSGSHRYILDYLMEEVLGHQPQDIQDFLLRTSILENLSGSLCDAVLEGTARKLEGEARPSQDILEYLERSNLFLVSLDADRIWYRYHHLFADLLRSRLQKSLDAATVQELYRRASQWYNRQGLLVEAIAQALASPDLTYAVDLLERNILTFFYQSEIAQVRSWLELLPRPLLRQHALLCAVYAASISLLHPYYPQSLPAAEEWMQAAERALATDLEGQRLERAFIYKMRSYWARWRDEPPERVLRLINTALSALPADAGKKLDRNQLYIRSALQTNLAWMYWFAGDEAAACQAFLEARRISSACGDLFNESSAINFQVGMSVLHGQLEEAVIQCREALTIFGRSQARLGHAVPFSGEIGVQLAEILLEWNELAEAETLLNENIELARWTMGRNILLRGYQCLARLAAIHGNPAAAFEYLAEAEKIPNEGPALAGAQRALLWLAWSDKTPQFAALAREWGEKCSLVEFAKGPPKPEWTVSMVLARVILANEGAQQQGKDKARSPGPGELLAWLERQEETVQARGWVTWQVQLLVLESLTRRSMGDPLGALAALRQAVELAQPGGYVRVFVQAGEPVRSLLAELEREEGPLSPYLRKLLSNFPQCAGPPAHPPAPGGNLPEPLTGRENEVLQLMAEGLSNHQIAARLFLADGTIKFYVHVVLEKLGVDNRTQAVLEAKKQKIL